VSNECSTYSSSESDALCRRRCCNAASCNAAGSTSAFCNTAQPGGAGTDYFNTCFARSEPGYSTLKIIGTACTLDGECKTGICDVPVGGSATACVDNCCVDTDCPSGQVCRARTGSTTNTAALLRCTMP
jgi:hypothetical protein